MSSEYEFPENSIPKKSQSIKVQQRTTANPLSPQQPMMQIFLILITLFTTGSAFVPSTMAPRTCTFCTTTTPRTPTPTHLHGFLDDVNGFFKKFTSKASASHILIKGEGSREKLENLLPSITVDNFATMASKYSACPSSARGGALGEFGPGQMVKEFDRVVFNDAVGVVHGPIKTQFGHHLILVTQRSE